MRKSWIVAVAVPLVVAGFAGPASADKPNPTPKPAPNEHITITLSVSTPQGAGTVVATGPIAGTGTATAATKGKHIGRVRFAAETLTFGSDTVKVRGINVHGPRQVAATTCTATEKGKGAFSVDAGTGAYAKAKGHGKFTVTATIAGTHDTSAPHGCSFKNPTGTIVIDATGVVTV